jgi:Lon protease-like protein
MTTELTPDAIPLFPLGVTLFPDGMLPLRIFEVRYLTMIKQCHRSGKPFGVVSLVQGGEVQQAGACGRTFPHHRNTGTDHGLPGATARPDRNHHARHDTLPHHREHAAAARAVDGRHRPLPADPRVKVPSDLAYVAANLVRMVDVFESAEVSPMLEPSRFDEAGWVANRWSELLPMPSEERQRLMEMTDPLLRLELVSDLLDLTEFGR